MESKKFLNCEIKIRDSYKKKWKILVTYEPQLLTPSINGRGIYEIL